MDSTREDVPDLQDASDGNPIPNLNPNPNPDSTLDPNRKRALWHRTRGGLLSCLVLSCLVLSCLVLPRLVLSCLVVSCAYLVLSHYDLSCDYFVVVLFL